MKYDVILRDRQAVASATMAFRFTRPAGFTFQAGQAVTLVLPDPPAEPNSRQRIFSLVSAPFEAELCIATRMREGSGFKRALLALPPGAVLRMTGPRGAMTLHEDRRRAAVFIAGGIGVTPFMSMLRQAFHDGLDRRLLLICSNRKPLDAPFLSELQSLAGRNGNFRLLARMTDEEGYLDAAAIRRFVDEAPSPVYYVAGPPAMVNAIKAGLRAAGTADEDVRSEQFYGY